MTERKPKTVVAVITLEDNVGSVLAKTKLEIPVTIINENQDFTEQYVREFIRSFAEKHLPTAVEL
jgi:hypothetical protein